MFTGIVQAKGKVARLDPTDAGVRLVIDRQGWQPAGIAINEGDSICVSGVCLTVVAHDETTVAFDVIGETLAKTTLGGLDVGSAVNLEPSLTATTPMGGHFVQGHVDGVAAVRDVTVNGDDYRIAIEPPAELMEYIVPKGSVTIDGVSMTVAAVTREHFEIALIPTTLELTTLGDAKAGTKVNLETDIVSKTIVNWMRLRSSAGDDAGVTRDTLREAGFM
jgi:riboflavin synthase